MRRTEDKSQPKSEQKTSQGERWLFPDKELAEIIGKGPIRESLLRVRLRAYVKRHKLKEPGSSTVKTDEKLQKVLEGREEVPATDLVKLVRRRLLLSRRATKVILGIRQTPFNQALSNRNRLRLQLRTRAVKLTHGQATASALPGRPMTGPDKKKKPVKTLTKKPTK